MTTVQVYHATELLPDCTLQREQTNKRMIKKDPRQKLTNKKRKTKIPGTMAPEEIKDV